MSARALTESEYETLKTRAAPGVRFSDSSRIPADRRRRTHARRKRARQSRAVEMEFLPTAIGIGSVVLLGTYLFGRQSAPVPLHGLGQNAQNAQIGSTLGNALGAVTGIPGLGQLGSVIGSLFGPSVHTDPMGIPQDTVQGIFNTTAQEMFASVNAKRGAYGLAPVAFPPIPQPGGAAMASWSTSIMAEVLYEPSLNSSSQDQLAIDRENGTMDAAIAAMQNIIKGLQAPAPPPPAPPQNYATAQGTPPAAPPPASYQATQQASIPASGFNWQADGPYVAGGMVLLALMFL